jgi:hypothetical protein
MKLSFPFKSGQLMALGLGLALTVRAKVGIESKVECSVLRMRTSIFLKGNKIT